MSHHQPSQFSPGQMMYGSPTQLRPPSGGMGPSLGSKRSRPDDLEDLGGMGMQGQHMRPGEMGSMSQQMAPQSMVGMSTGYGQQVQTFHSHALPLSGGHRSKMPRMSESDSMAGPSGSAPSVLGMEGMPLPAQRPRGPKLKFTPEDDGLLVDLKENKSLTWKQIAEFFPGRSSGTLQVRYCTKLKAKTTQWTDETVSSSCQVHLHKRLTSYRSRSFAQHSTIMSRRNGASSLRKSGQASRRRRVRRKLLSFSFHNI